MQTFTSKAHAKPKSILVVDDSVAVRRLLGELFLSEGFTSYAEAGTGSEAIDVARVRKPDLIILDAAMPVMTGIEAAPTLKSLLPETPIILFTLYDSVFKGWDLTSLGISATVSKTSTTDELVRKAHELIGE
jgi:CheY-like chemotaxis protein